MLTPGEFVISKPAVQKFGAKFFFKILNSGFKSKNIYNVIQANDVRFPNENSARMIDLIKDDFSQVVKNLM